MSRVLRIPVFASLVLLLAAAWTFGRWPPPRLLLRYGPPRAMQPTGRTLIFEGVEFVEISPGYFRMGSDYLAESGGAFDRLCAMFGLPWGTRGDPAAGPSDERPVHWAELRAGFWIARTETTNEQFSRFDPTAGRSEFSHGSGHPAVDLTWEDANRYCAWLAGKSGRPVRLPTEAEWACACRAGSRYEYCFGNDEESLAKYASFAGSSRGLVPVGSRSANDWGLLDFHGGVWEWCEDAYHDSYEGAPVDGSAWTADGAEWEAGVPFRVVRGGSWAESAVRCRSAVRFWLHPGSRSEDLGFRPAFSIPAGLSDDRVPSDVDDRADLRLADLAE